MFIIIDLRDQDDKSHDSVQLEFQAQATIKQLKDEIQSGFQMEPRRQRIFDSNDRRIDVLVGSLEEAGIKDNETLVLKHAELPWWPQYKKSVDIAMKPGAERMSNAKEAVKLHTRLMESGFFDVYSSFNSFRMENHHRVASWTDGNLQLMKEAVQSHFRAQHFKHGADDESDFICRFESRPTNLGGSRKNTLAYVQLHGEKEETKYNVKCHHFGSSSNSAKGQSPDIKEFFCYKLLELINVGPHAQFILPNKLVGSKTSTYIATKWNDDFVPISSIEKEEDVSTEVLVQLLLLNAFLFIDDLHGENCGQWKGTKEAAIVDFMPKAYSTYTNVKKALLNNDSSVYWEAVHVSVLEKCSEEVRLELAKECLRKWNLPSKIDVANEQIKPEKDRMKKQEIGFKGFNSPTEELDQYISAVKQNLAKLTDMLNVGE